MGLAADSRDKYPLEVKCDCAEKRFKERVCDLSRATIPGPQAWSPFARPRMADLSGMDSKEPGAYPRLTADVTILNS